METFKLAADCDPCPDGCGEPWCSDCQMHYADCDCPGPHSEEDPMEAVATETMESSETGVGVLVVTSKVKSRLKAKGLRVSADFIEFLSKKVEEMCDAAGEKALRDDRKTVKDTDLT